MFAGKAGTTISRGEPHILVGFHLLGAQPHLSSVISRVVLPRLLPRSLKPM